MANEKAHEAQAENKKRDVLENLAAAIAEVTEDALAKIEQPTMRDEEMVQAAAKMKAIRDRISEINYEISRIMPPEMKALESEKRKLKDRWMELAQDLENRVCSDSKQLNLDEQEDGE